MKYFLSNLHRRYMGLDEISDSFELKVIKESDLEEYYLFFEGDVLKKYIRYFVIDDYFQFFEKDLNYLTSQNREMILFDKKNMIERKITGDILDTLVGCGNYFSIGKNFGDSYTKVVIGNSSTNRKFYIDNYVEDCNCFKEIKKWADEFIDSCDESFIDEVNKFKKLKKITYKYKESDYFRVRINKDLYSYGRIVLDVSSEVKNKKLSYINVLMGDILVVEMFHVLTKNKNMTPSELCNLKTFPAQHILNDNFLNGEYEIIGSGSIDNCSYPILYGRGINEKASKIIFQYGYNYIESDFDENEYFGTFINNMIESSIELDYKVLEKCIKDKSNDYYYEFYSYKKDCDLFHPDNEKIRSKILKKFNVQIV